MRVSWLPISDSRLDNLGTIRRWRQLRKWSSDENICLPSLNDYRVTHMLGASTAFIQRSWDGPTFINSSIILRWDFTRDPLELISYVINENKCLSHMRRGSEGSMGTIWGMGGWDTGGCWLWFIVSLWTWWSLDSRVRANYCSLTIIRVKKWRLTTNVG